MLPEGEMLKNKGVHHDTVGTQLLNPTIHSMEASCFLRHPFPQLSPTSCSNLDWVPSGTAAELRCHSEDAPHWPGSTHLLDPVPSASFFTLSFCRSISSTTFLKQNVVKLCVLAWLKTFFFFYFWILIFDWWYWFMWKIISSQFAHYFCFWIQKYRWEVWYQSNH